MIDHKQTKLIFENWNSFINEAEAMTPETFEKELEDLLVMAKSSNRDPNTVVSKLIQAKNFVADMNRENPSNNYDRIFRKKRREIEAVLRGNTLGDELAKEKAKREGPSIRAMSSADIRRQTIQNYAKANRAFQGLPPKPYIPSSGAIVEELKTWDAVDWIINIGLLFVGPELILLKVPGARALAGGLLKMTDRLTLGLIRKVFAGAAKRILGAGIVADVVKLLGSPVTMLFEEPVRKFFISLAFFILYEAAIRKYVEPEIREYLGIPKPSGVTEEITPELESLLATANEYNQYYNLLTSGQKAQYKKDLDLSIKRMESKLNQNPDFNRLTKKLGAE